MQQSKRLASAARDQEVSEPIKVLYLDLDGTVRKGFDEIGKFVNGPEDVFLFPEALNRMREYKAAGWKLCGISNQGGIALGHVSIERVLAAMIKTQELTGNLFDKISFCRHHPDAADPYMAVCWCRKPRIGQIVEVAIDLAARHGMCPPHLALFVGDRDEDQCCAANAGIKFMWAKEWRETPLRKGNQ